MARKQKKLVIWGAGGHARVTADIFRLNGDYKIVAFFDDTTPNPRSLFLGLPVLRGKEELRKTFRKGARDIIIAIGDCAARGRAATKAQELGFQLCSAIHPRATVASSVKIGAGTVVAAGAVVNPGTLLGENVIINTCASVDHDCVIEDCAHVCPGTHLAGKVRVGQGAWIGIGSIVIEGIRIGKRAFIGAGAVVVRDMPEGVLAIGVPAKVVPKTLRKGPVNPKQIRTAAI